MASTDIKQGLGPNADHVFKHGNHQIKIFRDPQTAEILNFEIDRFSRNSKLDSAYQFKDLSATIKNSIEEALRFSEKNAVMFVSFLLTDLADVELKPLESKPEVRHENSVVQKDFKNENITFRQLIEGVNYNCRMFSKEGDPTKLNIHTIDNGKSETTAFIEVDRPNQRSILIFLEDPFVQAYEFTEKLKQGSGDLSDSLLAYINGNRNLGTFDEELPPVDLNRSLEVLLGVLGKKEVDQFLSVVLPAVEVDEGVSAAPKFTQDGFTEARYKFNKAEVVVTPTMVSGKTIGVDHEVPGFKVKFSHPNSSKMFNLHLPGLENIAAQLESCLKILSSADSVEAAIYPLSDLLAELGHHVVSFDDNPNYHKNAYDQHLVNQFKASVSNGQYRYENFSLINRNTYETIVDILSGLNVYLFEVLVDDPTDPCQMVVGLGEGGSVRVECSSRNTKLVDDQNEFSNDQQIKLYLSKLIKLFYNDTSQLIKFIRTNPMDNSNSD